jgi:hypothetical protein
MGLQVYSFRYTRASLGPYTCSCDQALGCDCVSFQPPKPLSSEMYCQAPLSRPGADRCREASLRPQGQYRHAGTQPCEAGPGLQPGHQVGQGLPRRLSFPGDLHRDSQTDRSCIHSFHLLSHFPPVSQPTQFREWLVSLPKFSPLPFPLPGSILCKTSHFHKWYLRFSLSLLWIEQ